VGAFTGVGLGCLTGETGAGDGAFTGDTGAGDGAGAGLFTPEAWV
jgi:hypothetical protein